MIPLAIAGSGLGMLVSQLEELLADESPRTREEIVDINTDTRPLALRIALVVPLLAGLANSFRMVRLPDAAPSRAAESAALG